MKSTKNTTCKVYKITCIPTKKIYVGITIEKYLSQRFWRHANRPGGTSYLFNCIKKYGKDNFTIEQLYEYDTAAKAKRKEKQLIKAWKLNRNRFPNSKGMNLTDGGDGSYGMRHTTASKKKMSGKNNHNHGLLGTLNPTSKSVQQLTLTGEPVKTFGSMHEAARFLKPGCDKRTQSSVAINIRQAILGVSCKQMYGYKWKYV